MPDAWSRRQFLRGLGATAVTSAVAGCTISLGSQANAAGTPADESIYTRVYEQTIDSVELIQAFTPQGVGQGSGFSYSTARRIVTNQHVVAGATELDVRFNDGTWRSAEVLGSDVYSDLAVLRVSNPPASVTPLSLRKSPPEIGQEVVAMGNPFGFEKSLSVGIVSGVNRSIDTAAGFSIPDAIQTDAALNPGNSGGPLVTLDGDVAGVVRSGGGDNIGFAVSAALVRRVVPALVDRGSYEHAYMGVTLLNVTPIVAEANGLDDPRGILVGAVREDGPAAGTLQPSEEETTVNGVRVPVGGDVIVELDGQSITTLNGLSSHLALETSPGDTLELRIIRDGELQTVSFELGTRPPPGSVS